MEGNNIQLQYADPLPPLTEAATDLQKRGLGNFYFLLPNDRGEWITIYTKERGHITLSKKEALFLRWEKNKATAPHPEHLTNARYPMVNGITLARLRFKMRRHDVRAIMPIFYGEEMVCVVLFGDPQTAYWRHAYPQPIKDIRDRLAHDVYRITHYNRTIAWLEKKIADKGALST